MIWLNGVQLEFGTFPNKETVVPDFQLRPFSDNHVRMRYLADQDLLHLVLVVREIQDAGGRCYLTLDYMPYSRMDRRSGDYAFSLRHVAWLINSLQFTKVRVVEPHSEVTTALLDRCWEVNAVQAMLDQPEVKELAQDAWIFLPDAGAQKRYKIGYSSVLVGNKTRDFATGAIKSLEVMAYPSEIYRGGTVLIVDDLCSRGGTFIASASALRGLGFAKVHLLVAHLEEAAFQGQLFDSIDTVVATDSMRDREAPSGSYRNLIEIPVRRFL